MCRLICLLFLFSRAIFAANLIVVNDTSKQLRLCQSHLAGNTIPADRVHNLGPQFIPHRRGALDADHRVIGVALNPQIHTGDFEGNAFHILDMTSGQVVTDTQRLIASAKAALATHEPRPLADFEPRFGVLSPTTPEFIYSLATSWNENCVISFNYETGQSVILARDANTNSLWMRKIEIAYDRYVVSHYTDRERTFYSFYDLALQRNLKVIAPGTSELRISQDGQRLLQTEEKSADRNTFFVSARFKLKNKWPEFIDLHEQKHDVEFDGAVVAAAGDLSRVVVDRSNGQTNNSYELYGTPWLAPDLALVRIAGDGRHTIKGLAGWTPILAKIRAAAKQGLILPLDSTKGMMSSDGKNFVFNLEFRSKVTLQDGAYQSAQLFDQNWIGFWDLNSGRKPSEITSKIFDTTFDQEQNPSTYTDGDKAPFWNRKIATRMLPSGLLLVARATVETLQDGYGNVHIKLLAFAPDAPPTSYLEYSTGPIHLNPTGLPSFTGVRNLQIGASGRTVIFHIQGVGTQLIDLR